MKEARHFVKRNGSVYLYEMAIPKSELADLKLQAGTSFGFVFKIGNGEGASVEYGKDKAVTKNNGLSLHRIGNPIPIAACAGHWWSETNRRQMG